MNKIIALNWKDTQTPESAPALIKVAEDVANIYPEFTWIIFPGDNFSETIQTKLSLGAQDRESGLTLPYYLIGHVSQRLQGITDEKIQQQLETLISTSMTPVLCVGPVKESDTLEGVLREQLVVLENWPKEKKIIIAYEPGFSVGTGKTMTLDDIEIVYDILREALRKFTNKSIIYGGSVNDTNIVDILRITDGVIIGTASQKSSSLLALSIALGQE